MPVSWFWIKQRPQFIAQGLTEYYNVSVACIHDYDVKKKLKTEEGQFSNFRLFGFPTLSLPFKFEFLNTIQFWLKKFFLNWLIFQSEIVVFTVPEQIIYSFKWLLRSRNIIYDCMDDMPAFYEDNIHHKNRIIAHEKVLCQVANKIVVSSAVLESRLQERYHVPKEKITIINNGIRRLDFININTSTLKHLFSDKQFKYIVYFGTIAEWFDIDTLIELLDKYNNIKLIIFGPSDSTIPTHSNIIYGGILKHDQIESAMIFADTLIMPFKKTELVLAVNPVKAYEYIASGRPVILTSYGETQKFAEYAYLYEDKDSLDELFLKVSKGELLPKMGKEMCEIFGLQNTWSKRIEAFESVINMKINIL